MKKQILSLILLIASLSAFGQSFTLSTNLWFTNTIVGTNTQTYVGTNYLDVTRYKTFSIVATGNGTNLSTNTLVFNFKASPTGTNWEQLPSMALSGTVNGTNPFVLYTNLTLGDGIGYLKPYQIVSSITNTITNAWIYGAFKMFPRN